MRRQPTEFLPKKHKVPNGRCKWYVEGYVEGKRRKWSFVNKSEAYLEAERLNKELKRFGTDGFVSKGLSPAEQSMAIECFQLLRPHKDISLLKLVHEGIARFKEIQKSKTVTQLCEAYELYCEGKLQRNEMRARNVETVRDTTSKLKAKFGELLICDLKGQAIWEWLASLPLAPSTRDRHLSYCRMLFKWALRRELVVRNPV